MKYKLIGNNSYKVSPLETVARNREVDNLSELLGKSELSDFSPFLLSNMKEGVETLVKAMEGDKRIHLKIDSDVDGSTSASHMYLYLCDIYDKSKITWSNHDGKKHGIIMEELDLESFDVLLMTDASSNDYDQHKLLKDCGKTVIVLDHHEAQKISEDAIVINPKLDDSPNKELSGVEVVHKFCKAIDILYGFSHADKYLDLVAIGLISDMMNTTVTENRYYINKGLSNIKNPFFKALISHFGNKIKVVKMDSISYYIAPLINAIHRIGTVEEKDVLFRCLTSGEDFVFDATIGSKGKKGFSQPKTYVGRHLPRLLQIKKDQDDIKNGLLETYHDAIELESANKSILIEIPLKHRSFTGLLAGSIAGDYNKPTFVVVKNKSGTDYSGSGRNYSESPIEDLRGLCNDTLGVDWARGHNSSFGIHFNNKCDIKDFKKNIASKLESVPSGKVYNVDFLIPAPHLKTNLMSVIGGHDECYGKGFESPSFCVTDIVVDKMAILTNDAKTMLKFPINNVKEILAINFKNVEKMVGAIEAIDSDKLKINIIGRVNINEWAGRKTYQVILDDYEVLCYNKTEDKFWF